MRTQVLFAFALITVSLAYTLPDLGVNQDTATCTNVATLQAAAQSDKTRLNTLITNLKNVLPYLQQDLSIIDTVKVQTSKVTVQTSFLQTNVHSKLAASMKASLKFLYRSLSEIADADPIITKMIGQQLKDTLAILNQIDAETDQTKLNTEVAQAKANLNDMVAYINWAVNEINTKWLTYLDSRISSLATTVVNCNKPKYSYVQTAAFGGNGGHEFTSDPTSGRDNYKVKQILVKSGDDVDSIQLVLTDGSNTITNDKHGGSGGSLTTITPPARVKQIKVYYDQYVKGIQFFYDNGSNSGVLGHSSGLSVGTVDINGELIGVYGREGYYIDKLGFIVKTTSS